MNWLRLVQARLFGLLHKRQMEAEMEEEVRFHLAQRTQENVARGMSQPEAMRVATRQFGNVGVIKEEWRDVSGGGALEVFWRDLCFAARMLRKDHVLTATAVLTLGLGVGANTAIFTILSSVLLHPLPFPEPDKLMRVWSSERGQPETRFKVSFPDFLDLQSRNRTFDGLGAFVAHTFSVDSNSAAAQVQGAAVTSDIFPMLGARAAYGRIFSRSDDEAGNRSVIISDKLWDERFARAANVTEASLNVEGENYAIIGVMPRGFHFPVQNHAAELWITLGRNHELGPGDTIAYTARRDARYLHLLGRLKSGRSNAEAQSDLDRIAAELAVMHPESNARFDAGVVTPWLADLTSEVRPALLMLIAAAACLLGIACANIAILLLARSGTRAKEIALRAALGAGRGRIARQLLTESLLLGVAGGAAGLLLASIGTRLLVGLLPPEFPRAGEITPDGGMLAFAALVSVVASGIFGLAPAWHASRSNLAPLLNDGSGPGKQTHGSKRLRNQLVVAEIVMAVVLLACACGLIENVWLLQNAPLGFDRANVLTAAIMVPDERNGADSSRASTLAAELLKRVRQLPGVVSASAASRLPAVGPELPIDFRIVGRDLPKQIRPRARLRIIFPDYFRTMGIAIEQGRDFEERDSQNAVPVMIINQSTAQRILPKGNALGARIILPLDGDNRVVEREIIGIVGDVKSDRFSAEQALELYLPYPRSAALGFSLLIRSGNERATLLGAVRGIAQTLDKKVAFYEAGTLEEHVDAVLAQPRLNSAVLAAFAIIAVALTAIGVYGVTSYSVAQRRHEIGIRVALGAQKSAILQLVLGESARLIVIGVATGIICSLATLSRLGPFLHHTPGHSVSTTLIVALVVSGVASLACWFPARRASREDPLDAIGLL